MKSLYALFFSAFLSQAVSASGAVPEFQGGIGGNDDDAGAPVAPRQGAGNYQDQLQPVDDESYNMVQQLFGFGGDDFKAQVTDFQARLRGNGHNHVNGHEEQ